MEALNAWLKEEQAVRLEHCCALHLHLRPPPLSPQRMPVRSPSLTRFRHDEFLLLPAAI